MADRPDANWGKFLGLGMQAAVGIGVGLWAGDWADGHWKIAPWGTLVGALLGLAGGMYPLLAAALRANRD